MDPALRLLAGACLVVAVGWAPLACSAARSVSPATRDALVRTALDEARYQCVTNPPNDARLQAACLALLEVSGSEKTDATTSPGPEPIPSASPPSDAGAMNVVPGNAVRYVER